MARVVFTQNIQRLVSCPEAEAKGHTVAEVMEKVFADNPKARLCVVDEHGAVRKHMALFVNGELIKDRERMTDAIAEDAEIYIMQALSGG